MSEAAYVDYQVKVDDETIKSSESAEITNITVDLEVDKLDMCSITFVDAARNVLKGARHKVGDKMEVQLGYDTGTKPLFLGELVALEPSWPEGGRAQLAIRGLDRLHRFKRGTQIRFWEKKKDSDVVKQIAGELGLSSKIDATSEQHEYTLQNNLPDAEFLKYLARRNHYELFVKDQELNFIKPAAGGATEVELKHGVDVMDLRMRLNAVGQVGEVIVRGWDVFQKKEITGKADKGKLSKGGGKKYGIELAEGAFGASKAYVTDYPVKNQGEANDLAKALLGGVAGSFLTGSGRCLGNPDIKPGATVNLKQFGDYSGKYYVVATRHMINPQGYFTEFDIASNTDGAGE
jgi:phage protein D